MQQPQGLPHVLHATFTPQAVVAIVLELAMLATFLMVAMESSALSALRVLPRELVIVMCVLVALTTCMLLLLDK